jgi:hypothetical protein
MGLGLFLFLVAVLVLASWLYRADTIRIQKDYEDVKRNRR